jgi:hypothetical protein
MLIPVHDPLTTLPYFVTPQTQLPPDYIDLEKRVDALKQVHQKLLAVT